MIGHSMGGKTAMTLALTEPDRISQLIVVDIGPDAYGNDYDHLLAAMSGLDLNAITRRADAQTQLKQAIPDNEIRAFILQNLHCSTDSSPHWRLNLPVICDSIDAIVGAIPGAWTVPYNAPTYFIRGENSDRISGGSSLSISKLFPYWASITIANAGHWPHAANPMDFLAKLHQLLD